MKEERFIDRLKGVSGCVWFLFAGFIIVGLFLIIAGSIVYALYQGTEEGGVAILCIGAGVICEVLFLSIGIIIPFIQWKKGITAESTRVWKSGVLTSKIIIGDVFAHTKSKVISLFVATGVVALIIISIGILSEEKNSIFYL